MTTNTFTTPDMDPIASGLKPIPGISAEDSVETAAVAADETAATDAAATDATPARPAEKKPARSRSTGPKMDEKKELIRQEVYERRQQLRPAERSTRSRKICNQLITELQSSGIKGRNGQPPTIAVYSAKRFEVDLDRFIRGAFALGCRIVFPCMIPQSSAAGGMCMRSVSCLNYLSGTVPFIVDPMKPWGPAVSEEQHQSFESQPVGSRRRFVPSRGKGSVPPKDDARFPVVAPNEVDFTVVPLVAFDDKGNRLGYGGGVYDRFLPQLREDCRIVGVGFAEQEVDKVPHAKHDIVLPQVISA